jgi:uncharacterized membrane protein
MPLDSEIPSTNNCARTLLNMRGIVIHFLKQDILNLHPMIYWGLAAIWLLLLISAVVSVRSLEISTAAKAVWLLLILFVPVAGLALYAFRCLLKSNWEALAPLFHSRKLNQQLPSAKAPVAPRRKA